MEARAYKRGGDPVVPPNGGQAPVAPGVGDRPLSPVGGDRPLFFLQGPRCEFEEKNYTLGLSSYEGRPGGIFEILQNGHIFLKFLFF